ncbi:Glutamate or tyrosine decarboxylase [Nocardioides terrae]|uniref:Glutamate or tyrosine decarboxylase n=1 Tax=Nocardioides terrae TaxID=574651 RepID=A0A1I1JHJ3_9ACTN|nr:pyridoxal-dependent decarboxylase [Nocardioides terrae]SFC48089.1 Glutamate or tyrosine decarboxylase [Nocardioides terrae]
MDPRTDPLERAHRHAADWFATLGKRPVPASATADEVSDALGRDLPAGPSDPGDVVDLLARACEPGLTAMPSGRFYGLVIGGTEPAALAADWLVGAWDQNNGLRAVTPAVAAVEEVAAAWLLDLLGLPAEAAVGFPTSATTANLTCLLAARDRLLGQAGWDTARDGLTGAPRVRVITGAEGHESVHYALRYLGLGRPDTVAADDQGRLDPAALAASLRPGEPTIVVLQAGNVHSGAFDPFGPAIAAAHDAGAWVHVDGAFGLFAAVSPALQHLTAGVEGADSWTTDAHKTLNVPYDCGIAIVRDPVALGAAAGKHGDYLILDEAGDPFDRVPELSRRARGVPVWAVLRSLGRSGVADLVDGFCRHAAAFAEGIRAFPRAEVLNDVDYTQVCAAFGDDERTRAVTQAVLADGTAWMSGSRWHDRAVLRVSVSNWATTEDDVRRSLDALERAVRSVEP